MAKKRRVSNGQRPAESSTRRSATTGADGDRHRKAGKQRETSLIENLGSLRDVDPMLLALAALSAALVYVMYYPSDSVSVEKGDALWFGLFAVGCATLTFAAYFRSQTIEPQTTDSEAAQSSSGSSDRTIERMVAWTPWAICCWIFLSAFMTSPPGNLRVATNEAWLWVSGAALFTSARLLLRDLGARRAVLSLTVVCAVGLAVHGLHQYFVSLPQNRMEYQQDPDRVLEMAGIDAPPGSAERMVFANRLFDGGPTGTFALANSLAAVLLVGVVMSVGVLWFRWRHIPWGSRVSWILVVAFCATCLMAARSRSATLATLIAIAAMCIGSTRWSGLYRRKILAALTVLVCVAVLGALYLAAFGNREWFEEAPASLAFRFQYWRATWELALDHPVFGVGPGNFQSLYQRYREASATEQVAEPHNLFFETLAAGGFFAAGLLGLLIAAGGLRFVTSSTAWHKTESKHSAEDEIDEHKLLESARWVWLGAIISLSLVWLIGFAVRFSPDITANLYVLPICIGLGLATWSTVRVLSVQEVDTIVAASLLGLAIHLMVAGGWTVPGVAIFVWIFGGMLTRKAAVAGVSQSGSQVVAHATPISSIATLLVGVTALLVLVQMSLRPVEECKRLLMQAALSQSEGRLAKTESQLRQAVDADPWAPDAVLWLADFYHWKLILRADDPSDRSEWQSLLRESQERAGDNPAVARTVGSQQVHLYQAQGDPADLRDALDTFQWQAGLSPSDQWVMAQVALLSDAAGEAFEARAYGDRARELSMLGGNIERALDRQMIYLPTVDAAAARQGPIRKAAGKVLPEPNGNR